MNFKVTFMTQFKLVRDDLDKFDPKMYYEVEVSGSNTVADFHSKLTEMIGLRSSDCVAEYYKEWFGVGKLEWDERVKDGSIVYAEITTKKKLEEIDDDNVHKGLKSKFNLFDKLLDDAIRSSLLKK